MSLYLCRGRKVSRKLADIWTEFGVTTCLKRVSKLGQCLNFSVFWKWLSVKVAIKVYTSSCSLLSTDELVLSGEVQFYWKQQRRKLGILVRSNLKQCLPCSVPRLTIYALISRLGTLNFGWPNLFMIKYWTWIVATVSVTVSSVCWESTTKGCEKKHTVTEKRSQ